jgi:hypothetical protein
LRAPSGLTASTKSGIAELKTALTDPAALSSVRSGALLPVFQKLQASAASDADKKAVAAVDEMLAGRSAQVSVVDPDIAARMSTVIATLETALGHAEPQYFPIAELNRSIDTMNTLPAVIEESKEINDSVAAQVYATWIDIWKKGFPFPNVKNGSLTGEVSLVSKSDAMDSKIAASLERLRATPGSVEDKIKAAFPGVDPAVVLNDYLRVDPNAAPGHQIKVNVSALGPFGSAMIIWGDSREDANAIMDPHRLSPHHNGNSDDIEHAPEIAGKHDLLEFAPLVDVQQQMKNKFFPAWIANMTATLEAIGDALLQRG